MSVRVNVPPGLPDPDPKFQEYLQRTIQEVTLRYISPKIRGEVVTPEENAGRKLRELRIARGWSQEELAERMKAYGYDWHQTLIGRIESAQRPLRLNDLADMCGVFGVTVGVMLGQPQAAEAELLATAQARIAHLERQIARARQALD